MVEDQLFELVELGHYLQKYLRKTYPCQRVQVNAVLVEVAEESVHRDISKWYNVGQTRNEICVPQEFRGGGGGRAAVVGGCGGGSCSCASVVRGGVEGPGGGGISSKIVNGG
ncbi:hypothetical protein Tco_1106136, partial [Tanacetum coccineum]